MSPTRRRLSLLIFFSAIFLTGFRQAAPASSEQVFGFHDFTRQAEIDRKFNQSPDAKLAEEHLRTLTQAPHVAGSPEDRKTAEYVAQKFRQAGLDTQIVEYKVLLSFPQEVSIDITSPANVSMHGPSREHVEGDPYQDDPRVLPAYNAYSPSGDVEADVVYANYGSPQDYKQLDAMKVDVRGKTGDRSLWRELSRGEELCGPGARSGGSDHLLRSHRRWLLSRRHVSQRPLSSGYGSAAWIDRFHFQICRRSHDAGHCFAAKFA